MLTYRSLRTFVAVEKAEAESLKQPSELILNVLETADYVPYMRFSFLHSINSS